MEVHMGRASKAELRDVRRVEGLFRYESAHQAGQGRGRRGEQRREGDRRDVDISSLPRDEQAYIRMQLAQREIVSRQIGNVDIPPPRAQGTFPTLDLASSTAAPEPAPRQLPIENFPPLGAGPLTPVARPTAPPTPGPSNLPPQVAARHTAVLEKAAKLLGNDKDKLAQFKTHVSSFRHSELLATDLIDRLWDIFNAKLDEFGKLITSTADLFDYDAKPKRAELLGAWNDWKIQVQTSIAFRDADAQMQEANTAASGFLPQQGQRSRILALKSSARGRSVDRVQSVWNRIEAVAASISVPGPSVTRSMGALNLNSAARPPIAWTPSSGIKQAPATRTAALSTTQPSFAAEEFPSLPAAKPKERVTLNAAAGPARPVQSWGETQKEENVQGSGSTPAEQSKRKGKKKGKQILFRVG